MTTKAPVQHTLGPWKLDPTIDGRGRGYIRCNKGSGTAVCRINETGHDYEEAQANARLICAAPELLEACREIIEGMIDGPNSTQKNVTAFAIHKVQAAIAKAEAQ